MSRVDDLIEAYSRFVSLPWPDNVAPAQRVWMAVYPPDDERRIRLHLPAFEAATVSAGHSWAMHDITTAFEHWLANHEFAETYLEDPELLETVLPSFLDHLAAEVRTTLEANPDPDGVVGLLGAGTLFGLGPDVKVSNLVDRVADAIAGRLLVWFPGHYDHNSYRLLDARDGWNYLAVPITAEGAHR